MNEKNFFPEFSVLMAVYIKDNPFYLDLALKSIENQTVKPAEIVLVADGPLHSDLYTVINKHIEQNVIKYNFIQKDINQGLGLALKEGTKYVSTKWIARMDADDISVHNRFEYQLKCIGKNQDLAILGGQVDEFDNNVNNIIGKRRVPLSQEGIRKFLKWRNPFNHPTVMIRKEVLDKIGGYQDNHFLEDYILWAKIIARGYKVANLNRILVHMRTGNGIYERRGDPKTLCQFYNLRSFLRKKGLATRAEEIIGDIVVTLNILMPNFLRKFLYKSYLHKNKRLNVIERRK